MSGMVSSSVLSTTPTSLSPPKGETRMTVRWWWWWSVLVLCCLWATLLLVNVSVLAEAAKDCDTDADCDSGELCSDSKCKPRQGNLDPCTGHKHCRRFYGSNLYMCCNGRCEKTICCTNEDCEEGEGCSLTLGKCTGIRGTLCNNDDDCKREYKDVCCGGSCKKGKCCAHSNCKKNVNCCKKGTFCCNGNCLNCCLASHCKFPKVCRGNKCT